jgi:hypothetical protein
MLKQIKGFTFIFLACALLIFPSCLTSKKLDRFVAARYNHQLPKLSKKKKAEIEITSLAPAGNSQISTTVHKTDKFLPLLVYWKYDHRQSCSLNPAIAVTNFSNAMNSFATKALIEKLNGRKLELSVEQAPSVFSLVIKENIIWLIYAFGWSKIYIEPDKKDLIVAYKLAGGDGGPKTGTIIVKTTDRNIGLRFFQSWKSATSEYLSEYDANLTSMTKAFVNQLANEL